MPALLAGIGGWPLPSIAAQQVLDLGAQRVDLATKLSERLFDRVQAPAAGHLPPGGRGGDLRGAGQEMAPALFALAGLPVEAHDDRLVAPGQPVEDAFRAPELVEVGVVAFGPGPELVDGLRPPQQHYG